VLVSRAEPAGSSWTERRVDVFEPRERAVDLKDQAASGCSRGKIVEIDLLMDPARLCELDLTALGD
jgi:hypothetical protein